MGTITILPETTKNPITLMGARAGCCWNANITDDEKNYKRGLDCIKSGHGRVMEYVNVEMIIDGYSAKVLREYYTHIGGSPSRLQASTRYINYSKGNGFAYVTPQSISNDEDVATTWGTSALILTQRSFPDTLHSTSESSPLLRMLLWKYSTLSRGLISPLRVRLQRLSWQTAA